MSGLFRSNASSDGSVVKYYAPMGKTIAVRQAPDHSGTSVGTLSYVLSDQLGSSVGMMDASGAVTGTQTYWPYGATRSATGVLAGTAPTDRQYTGQQQEAPASDALGLYDYKARFYSTTLGRFVSADTVADGLDRYAYTGDNPARFTDPTGHCFNGAKCNKPLALRIIACAFGGGYACQVSGYNSDDVQRLAQWVLTQDEFYGHVTAYAGSDTAFDHSVRSIRRIDQFTDYYLRNNYWIVGSPSDEGNGTFTVKQEAGHLEGMFVFYVDYSYLDFRVGGSLWIWHDIGGGKHAWGGVSDNFLTSIRVVGGGLDAVVQAAAGNGMASPYISDSLFHPHAQYSIQGSLAVNPLSVDVVPLCPWLCEHISASHTPWLPVQPDIPT